jgi:uncharacterized membrane protein
MMLGKLLEKLVQHGRLLGWIMLGVMAALVVADLLIPPKYQRYPWDAWGGFGALYGFVSCVLIIVVSKAIGKAILYKPEDYYDE